MVVVHRGQSKINELDLVASIFHFLDKHVLKLEIPVDNFLVVEVLDEQCPNLTVSYRNRVISPPTDFSEGKRFVALASTQWYREKQNVASHRLVRYRKKVSPWT